METCNNLFLPYIIKKEDEEIDLEEIDTPIIIYLFYNKIFLKILLQNYDKITFIFHENNIKINV